MLDREKLEKELAALPLYSCHFIKPSVLEFSDRVRWICEHECPMYGTTWACPPGVGSVEACRERCLRYENCLMISTVTEVRDIANIEDCLATRPEHEHITNQVRDIGTVQNLSYSPQKPAATAKDAATSKDLPAGIRRECIPAWKATGSIWYPRWKHRV